MNKLLKKIKTLLYSKEFMRIIRYGIIGVCTTLVSFISYRILYHTFNFETNISNIISILIAITFAYFTNKWYVFKSHCKTSKEFLIEMYTFFSARGITMLIEIIGVFILHNLLSTEEMLAKALTNIVVLILNYIISKVWVFNKKTTAPH